MANNCQHIPPSTFWAKNVRSVCETSVINTCSSFLLRSVIVSSTSCTASYVKHDGHITMECHTSAATHPRLYVCYEWFRRPAITLTRVTNTVIWAPQNCGWVHPRQKGIALLGVYTLPWEHFYYFSWSASDLEFCTWYKRRMSSAYFPLLNNEITTNCS